ncbi:hypothetical protein HJA_13205 [Hyphomonas jannaschiana VP2]|uniref:PDZ domain-containing protein n=2 Tax=Hyphomonas jannaschiana TaxID=86 RepID=A0A059FA67_9PROT|nr:hypothetical protein HJA_13205 [Hyphomonas jannaschiana VP2]
MSMMFAGSVLPSASAQSPSDCGKLGAEIELIRIPQPPQNSSGYGPVGPGEIDAAKVIGVQVGCAGEAANLKKGDAIFKIDGSFISANPDDPNFISKLLANAGGQDGTFSVTVGRGGRAGPHSIPTDLKIRPVAPKPSAPILAASPKANLAKWPETLADRGKPRNTLAYATDRIAVYGTDDSQRYYIIYDTAKDESLFGSEESRLELDAVMKAASKKMFPAKSKLSLPGLIGVGYFLNDHYTDPFNPQNELSPFTVKTSVYAEYGSRAEWYFGGDKLAQVAGKPPYSQAAFEALLAEYNQKVDKSNQDQIAEREFAKTASQNGYLTISQSEAQYEDLRDRARTSAAKKYGYVSWPNSTWALAPNTYSREASNPYKSSTVRTVFSGDYVGDEGVRQGILWAYVIAKDARCNANIVNGQSRSYTLIQDTSYFNMGWYVPRMSKNTHTLMVDGRLAGFLRGNRGQSFWDIVPQAQAENMYWFFNKVECGSPEMRQLEENLYRMMAGQRSLQKEKAGSQGTRKEKEFYTEGGREFFGLYSIAPSTTKLAPFYANGVRTTYRDVIRKYMSADGSYDWSNRRFFKDDSGNTYGFFYRENPYEDNDPFLRVRVVKLNPADIAYIIKVSTDGKVPFSYQAPILRKNPLGHLMWRFDYGIQDLNPEGGIQVFSPE